MARKSSKKNSISKNNKKKQKNKSFNSVLNFRNENKYLFDLIISLILLIVTIISFFKMGFIGLFLDNCFKYFIGSYTYILYTFLIFYPILVIFKKSIKNMFLIYIFLIISLFIFELIFYKFESYSLFSYKYVTLHNTYFLGGGVIAKYPIKLIVYLLSYYGAIITLISVFIVTLIIYFNKEYPEQMKNLKLFVINKLNKDSENINKQDKQSISLEKYEIEENTTEQYYNEIKDNDLVVDLNDFRHDNIEKIKKESNKDITKQQIIEEIDLDNLENNYENYILPPLSLLQNPVENKKISKEDIVNKSKILQSTFKNFGIEVKIVKAVVGPSITQFQIMPTPGTKVSKIVNLSSDIALNLAAKDIRIEAPIPGKSLIGIEIPNSINQLVTMKEVFVNDSDNSPLSVALGKDVSGESIFARLDKMPHLLVAGSTGSGKSVCINTIITSLLMKNKPDKVKLIMIDPKMVELSIYDGIPHLLTPVVTNPLKAADVLHKVVLEMEKRYKEFSIARVKNIEGYNNIAKIDPDYKELPYIIVIIDELADLMMVASKEVEESIARISQMARAAGIHLIIATQRPSVDVITGVIKTNIPSRIAFAVSSSFDSRTIIDKVGAETLLGKGDMLFQSAESNKPIRVQGAFLSDVEVESVVDFIKKQSNTDYDPDMQPSENIGQSNNNSEDTDPLYKEVLLFIAKTQKASASLLQRRFKIGYNRAARIIEMLEEDGYISQADGSKPRKVFLEPEFAENNE